MNKRNDIQWLRALAIFSVIGFHLWPGTFGYGYLGVDIFFVISGYLMTTIISKTDKNFKSIFIFYFRRIKRICPTYMLIICLTLLSGQFLLLSSYFNDLLAEGKWALGFATNIEPLLHKTDYFDMISEYKFLLHTWSLGVEMQFYFLAPFIFAFINYFISPQITVLILLITSFLCHSFLFSATVKFNFLFLRVWQFFFGSLAFYGAQSHAFISSEKIVSTTKFLLKSHIQQKLIALLIILLFCPINYGMFDFLRFFATFLTYITISIPQNPDSSSAFLNRVSSIFVYIGDASYSIYLIHWPIIIFFKYYDYSITIVSSLVILGIIFGTAIFIHEIFEKPFNRASNAVHICLLFGFYVISIYLCFTSNTVENSILPMKQQNILPTFKCSPDLLIQKLYLKTGGQHIKKCSHAFVANATVKREAVILGNSFAEAQFNGIAAALKLQNFSKVYLFSRASCLPHGGLMNRDWNMKDWKCLEWNENPFDDFLSAVKPDTIMLGGRLDIFKDLVAPIPSNISSDFAVNELKKQVVKFSSYSKNLIIVLPNPTINFAHMKFDKQRMAKLKSLIKFQYSSAATIAKALQLKQPIEKFVLPIQFIHEFNQFFEIRLKEATKNCSNCHIFNSTKVFCDDHGCPLYDKETKLGIMSDQAHLTPVGSLKLTKPFFELLNNISSLKKY